LTPKTKSKPKVNAKKGEAYDQRLIKALAHPLRGHALAILNERIASPNELSKELGEGLSQVSYHVKVLKDCECIELVKTEPRRGAVEHYYRATARAFLTDRDWAQLPASIQTGMSAKLLQAMFNEAAAALEIGTFDARDDRHVSWTPMIVDEKGWGKLIDVLAEALDRVLAIRTECSDRLAKGDAEGMAVSISMMGFEAPKTEEMHTKPKGRP
jgi:DNA-binding transcriptional ArsR family regulator